MAEFLGFYEQYPSHQGNMQLVLSGGSVVSPAGGPFPLPHLSEPGFVHGATEVHGVAAAPVQAIQHIAGAAGYLLPGITVEAWTRRATSCRAGGGICGPQPCNIAGYLTTDASRVVFRDDWFYSGDIGMVRRMDLILTGRENR
jgi:long-subunit acyl-CoA synthetase (AMP-forming)